MELKPYQQQVINDLEEFLLFLEKHQSPNKAFNNYWKEKIGDYQLKLDGSSVGMRPYIDNIPGAVHIAMKVPTAGGKTFIACNALHSINKYFNQGNPKAVVWLVPWSNLLQQTVTNLSSPDHPYRAKLNSLFNGRVEVYEKDELLQGANFNPASVTEQLNIFVFNFSSLRINSRKKDDRKVYQENGQLESFKDLIDPELLLPETDETALINIIRSLNPVVIVDESHNAESDLSVEMLNNLNPSLVLDLTATPKENSNIISFVNAMALKKEHMVKLPVVVYNHHKKEEVITSALQLQRKLELLAEEEEKMTGKYIRPIILFQAQSNIKGKNNTTFQKIKEKLVSLKIPEEQIKIKVSGTDELKDINLMSKDCPVRYIITVNALKEGWDCPNAYILASLADKSSAVDVEQILGRILRQPYVTRHQSPLLNLSFVLTASSKFNETLDHVVNGLQEAGFSKDDYYAEEAPEEELTTDEILQKDLFDEEPDKKSDEDFNLEEIEFDPESTEPVIIENDKPSIVDTITEKAEKEGKEYEAKVNDIDIDNTTNFFTEVSKTQPKYYSIDSRYREVVKDLKLPQFFRVIDQDEIHENILFEELAEYDRFLNKTNLLDGFNLANQNSNIDFDAVDADIYTVDFDEHKRQATVNHIKERTKKALLNNILSKPKDKQISEVSAHIVSKLGDMTPISEQELRKYVGRVFDNFSTDQIRDIIDNPFNYVQKIKQKINSLTQEYAKDRFQVLLDANEIKVKESFQFPETIMPYNPSTSITKSLYDREDSMNNYEQNMIMEIAGLNNIVFWHRNLSRGKGFFLNGFESNHYPDFIIYTKKGNVILIETKGDDRDNDDSRDKNRLGKVWANKAGENYKYFMVFQSKDVEDTYTAKSIIEVLKLL
ncbi:DEAD/DEAH box helicase family protein [Gramella jeungdoensis]|uniref:DEAD/DEAH box helicase family protein n=1 Tax=Gramella jeungdoensis TaxID=708091 RepID=A0ABT0Z1E2_9FLAO|nr:DEAD/DEAH box helicase family protein [Gramella jeungdoensis]MCM8569540.1 DEAD/DEAH box helicase family protein [Gramella jeungdoensis]